MLLGALGLLIQSICRYKHSPVEVLENRQTVPSLCIFNILCIFLFHNSIHFCLIT
uniref:Uncharacterized protein n=1 Tax=Arundo donax TaxID=35708 RepID=A0A0A9GYK2_ARUDO